MSIVITVLLSLLVLACLSTAYWLIHGLDNDQVVSEPLIIAPGAFVFCVVMIVLSVAVKWYERRHRPRCES